MRLDTWRGVSVFLTLAAAPIAATAHHAFAAEFDRDQPIEVTGTVTEIEWTNPHARIYIDVVDGDTLNAGDVVTVSGWRARNAPHVANARAVTLADGTRVFAGSSGGNAP
jgi:lipopolysaccharide export system protein LptA